MESPSWVPPLPSCLYYTFSANLRNYFVGSARILAGVPTFYAFQRRRAAVQ